ncbi:MAG: decarboxylating 6-phosphogluconate dehydrogenase [Candidatus Babeliales bacterium]
MKLGIIGLGKMGKAIAYRVLQANHEVIGYDRDETVLRDAEKIGVSPAKNIEEITKQTNIIWIMVPPGDTVDAVLTKLHKLLPAGSIIIDGGNSKFTQSIERAEICKKLSIRFLDCGTSGGLRGQTTGFSLMIGGDHNAYEEIKSLLQAIAAPNGYGYMGESGTGHYVKMVHNGIEYALMQAYADGFNLLKNGHFKNLDLANIASVWRNGSVIRSWLLELIHEILMNDQDLKDISGEVAESGMGRWTVEDAQEHNIPIPLIEDALAIRYWSQKTGGNYSTKIVALLRHKFGGHAVKKL